MVTTPRRGRFGIRVAAIVGAAAIVAGALTGCDEKDCRGSAASTVGARSTDGSLHEAPEGSRPRPKPKPTKSKGKKPCPPKDGGTKDKHGKEQKMFGADGERMISKTLHEGHVRGYRYRIDVENRHPASGPVACMCNSAAVAPLTTNTTLRLRSSSPATAVIYHGAYSNTSTTILKRGARSDTDFNCSARGSTSMYIPSDMLPNQWQVVLKDGSTIGVWAGMYGEHDGYYTFDVLAEASAEEQADQHLVITGDNPTKPERVIFTVARIPIDLVANIYSRPWDTRIKPKDLTPTEWDQRPRDDGQL